jgi:hypothetical protein
MSATAILNLSKAGSTEAQVTALAEYFDSQMATRTDIAELNVSLKADIAELHVALEKVRGELELKIAAVELKIVEAKADTIKWVAGLLIAQGAAVVALVKLLPGAH